MGVAEGAKETLLVEERRAARAFPIVQTYPLEVDCYVLVQRSTGALCQVRVLGQRGVGSGGMLVDLLMLTAEPAVDLRREGWTLIKVRLAARERWVQEFRDLPVAKAGSPEKGGQ
jgi:hypothetical protein